MTRLRTTAAGGVVSAMVVAGALVGVGSTTPAGAIPPECQQMRQQVRTEVGQTVWIPTSRQAGPFQWGGSQSRSVDSTRMTAKTKGSADTVGGSAGVGFSVVELSAKYDRQWNRSTTATSSKTSRFITNSPVMPKKVHWRWKLYKQGRLFKATKRQWIPRGCPNHMSRKATIRVFVPVYRGNHSYKVERWAKRGRVLNAKGEPFSF